MIARVRVGLVAVGLQSPPTSAVGCLARLTWLLVGNFALGFCSVLIALGPSGLGLADIALWLCAGVVVAARWIDLTKYAGTTAEGAPATLAHWRRHAIIIGGATSSLWIAAHAIAWLRTP